MHAVSPRRLGDTIAETLERTIQEYIVQLRPGFEPGQRISVDKLARGFGVSATPVKEALKRLEVHGLVQIRPRRGIYVTRLSYTDVEEISAVREALEEAALRMCRGPLSAELVAQLEDALYACEASFAAQDFERYRREDLRFHRLFVEAGGNQRLVMLYQSLLDQLGIVLVYTPRTVRNIEASLQEHRRLVELAKAGDLKGLERELAAHWESSKKRIYAGYAEYLQDTDDNGSASDGNALSASRRP